MKNILIIDDNPQNCEDYVAPLKEVFNVTISMSLRDAERKIKLHDYDLIVIDIMMPTSGIKKKDGLKTGLFFYEEKLVPLEKQGKTMCLLFWSNLTQNTYNEFFRNGVPQNVDFAHKETRDKNHLLTKVIEILNIKPQQ